MLACKCDVCGKLYEMYNCAKNTEEDANGFKFVNIELDGCAYNDEHTPKDVCPECMDALKQFLRERGKTQAYIFSIPF